MNQQLAQISELLKQAGATDIVMVGGCVRDHLLGIPSKDYDVEVYGLSYSQMATALNGHFRTNQVGQSFNVLKIGNEIDLTIPRRESKQGLGHKGFQVEADPNMTFQEAAGRRDFTINAIGMRTDGTLCDPYHGVEDLHRKILRAPTEAFCDDPLRVLRGMQFAARFGFEMEPRTIELCKKVLPEFSTLSEERLFMEWYKWAAKGDYPSQGLRVLQQTEWLSCFPELSALAQTPFACTPSFSTENTQTDSQNNVYGWVGHVCDAAAQLALQAGLDEKDRVVLLFAALCHDFGRAVSSCQNKNGTWTAPQHECLGIPAIEQFFQNMKFPLWIPENVLPLCRYHRIDHCAQDRTQPSDRLLRKLAVRLEPSSIRLWSFLASAINWNQKNFYSSWQIENSMFYQWILSAQRLNVAEKKQAPLLLGRDLIQRGFQPGPKMGSCLDKMYQAQLNGDITTKEEALLWLDKNK